MYTLLALPHTRNGLGCFMVHDDGLEEDEKWWRSMRRCR